MTRTLLKFVAWLTLAFIVFATVSPIGLRPHDFLPVDLDRALAFATLSFLFVIAYPQHWKLCALLMVLATLPIEMLQYLSPSRHPHLIDAAIKAAGATIGILAGWLVHTLYARRSAIRA
ncbi:VanZ family protein [Rhizobium sp. FY34]|uniref:VanZ family protein n=1 Tax=Rhizobium sp. FY34 TaxID=2562309 RepID=UPI0032B2C100